MPPLGPVRPSPATADGFARAVGLARRRRWQQIGTTSCVALVVVLCAGLLTRGGPLTNGLTPAASDHATPSPTAPVTLPRPAKVAPRPAGRRPAGHAPAPPSVVAPPRPTHASPVPAPASSEVVTGSADRLSAPDDCKTIAASGDWCGAVVVRRETTSIRYAVWLCPPANATPGHLSFPTAQEVDVAVSRDGTEVWRWSRGQTFATDAHTVPTDPHECRTWEVWWTSPMAGTYDVTATVTATEVAGREFSATMR